MVSPDAQAGDIDDRPIGDIVKAKSSEAALPVYVTFHLIL